MNDIATASVASQLIPMGGRRFLLPNTAVAEIVAYDVHGALAGAPEWLLGAFAWRGMSLPLVSIARICGWSGPAAPTASTRIVVLNALGGNRELPFVALLAEGTPQLVQVYEARLSSDGDADCDCSVVLAPVLVNGVAALIPDLDALEGMVHEHQRLQGDRAT